MIKFAVQFNLQVRVFTGVDSQSVAIIPKSIIKSQNEYLNVLTQEVQPLSQCPTAAYAVGVIETTGKAIKWDGLSIHSKLNQGHFCLDSVDVGEQASVTLKKIMPKFYLLSKRNLRACPLASGSLNWPLTEISVTAPCTL